MVDNKQEKDALFFSPEEIEETYLDQIYEEFTDNDIEAESVDDDKREEEPSRYVLIYIQNPEIRARFEPMLMQDMPYLQEEHLLIGAVDTHMDRPCGVLGLTVDQTDINIEYIYVPERYRGEAIGSMLFEGVKEMAAAAPIPLGIECAFSMDNETVFNFFYDRPDIKMTQYVTEYIVTPEDMKNSGVIDNLDEASDVIDYSISSMEGGLDRALELLNEQGIEYSSTFAEGINEKLSQILLKNGELQAAILVAGNEENLRITYMMYKNTQDRFKLHMLLGKAFSKIYNNYPNQNVKVNVRQGMVEMSQLFEGISSDGGICIARWDYT